MSDRRLDNQANQEPESPAMSTDLEREIRELRDALTAERTLREQVEQRYRDRLNEWIEISEALGQERDDVRAALERAEAERDALRLRVAELEQQMNPGEPGGASRADRA
jgi:chromosome segregation ATPase